MTNRTTYSYQDIAEVFHSLPATAKVPIFLYPAFAEPWIEHILPEELPGFQLEIVIFEDQGEVQAVLPLLSNGHLTHLIGHEEVSDYLDIIILGEGEKTKSILDEVAQCFTNQKEAGRAFHFANIAHTSWLYQLHSTHSHLFTLEEQTVCPVIKLPSAWDEYFAGLDPRQAKNFKRQMISIGEEDEISYRCLTKPEEVAVHIDSFIDLHAKSSTEKQAFWTEGRKKFMKVMATAVAKLGKLRLYFLDVNEEPAATVCIFDHQNEFQLYNSGLDAYRYGYLGVGNVIVLHTIREAIEQGRVRYDFLRGDEEYKFNFGAVGEAILRLKG